ncbi:Cell division protein FtsX [compost metagenome]
MFIRWPFFVEGALIGLIGSVITVGILFIGYNQLALSVKEDITLAFHLVPLNEVGPQITVLLVGLGLLIGIWGSTVSIRRFLKV